ncbi:MULTISPECIES: hypothetical protein [Ralstonia solanacearum species complex]|nr:hypothetical protein [Ralstonia solanacearum]
MNASTSFVLRSRVYCSVQRERTTILAPAEDLFGFANLRRQPWGGMCYAICAYRYRFRIAWRMSVARHRGELDEMSWNLIAQIEAGDHILDALEAEGPARLALVADLQQNAEPVFALRLATGEPVHLVSHDGCGFIRESLARQIPANAQAMEERARARPSADTPYGGLNVIVRSARWAGFRDAVPYRRQPARQRHRPPGVPHLARPGDAGQARAGARQTPVAPIIQCAMDAGTPEWRGQVVPAVTEQTTNGVPPPLRAGTTA